MSAIDFGALQATPLDHEPFDHLVVPGFVRAAALDAVNADFPKMDLPGSFPMSELDFGAAFSALIEELSAARLRLALQEKFDLDLAARPLMCTVRGRCRSADGRIHADSASKILTVLIYVQPAWEAAGGRLRLLRSAHDIEDYAAEISPRAGTMLAFRCTETAWHGHKPFEGERRSIQLNWVTSRAVAWREQWRHRISARAKTLFSVARGGSVTAGMRG